jgi:hypothetical protein
VNYDEYKGMTDDQLRKLPEDEFSRLFRANHDRHFRIRLMRIASFREYQAERAISEAKIEEMFAKNPDEIAELNPKELAKQFGVRPNPGNCSHIRHKIRQHQKAAE